MYFEKTHLYHLYNQGNNKQKIFFNRENYLFFLTKIKNHILPFADIIAWCLMPNHFHIMIYVNKSENNSSNILENINHNEHYNEKQYKSLQQSIGIMLSSYTRAINNKNLNRGSLFRKHTKANQLTGNTYITRSWYIEQGVTKINFEPSEKQYPNICFNYINFNPLKDGLVRRIEEWEFSSYLDIKGLRKGNLINRDRIKEFGLRLM